VINETNKKEKKKMTEKTVESFCKMDLKALLDAIKVRAENWRQR
jgi:hypothetical protein